MKQNGIVYTNPANPPAAVAKSGWLSYTNLSSIFISIAIIAYPTIHTKIPSMGFLALYDLFTHITLATPARKTPVKIIKRAKIYYRVNFFLFLIISGLIRAMKINWRHSIIYQTDGVVKFRPAYIKECPTRSTVAYMKKTRTLRHI